MQYYSTFRKEAELSGLRDLAESSDKTLNLTETTLLLGDQAKWKLIIEKERQTVTVWLCAATRDRLHSKVIFGILKKSRARHAEASYYTTK
jgi:hypothetical protein